MLRVLSAIADVDLLSLVHDDAEASHSGDLRDMCRSVTLAPVSPLRRYPAAVRAVFAGRPLTHALLDSPAMAPALARLVRDRRPDVVIAYCSGMARFAMDEPLASIPFVLDMVDVDSQKWASLGAANHSPKAWVYRREGRYLSRFEALAARRAKTTLVVNAREDAAMRKIAPGADVRIVPNGIDAAFFEASGPPADAPEVVFCGVMNYQPNADAAVWLMREVWPRVRSRRSDAALTLVGSSPGPEVREAAAADRSVVVTGRVEDVRPYLWRAALSVAPLLTARGVQNKVLEATAAGLPSVVTRAVFDGLPAEVGPACVLAESADAFAEAIVALLDATPAARRARAARADLSRITWEQALSSLPAILQSACLA
jgi:sugar transferase (PEP-CTERM/EpsH1 system associated)